MSRLIAIIGFAVLVVAGISGVNAAFQASGHGYHVNNESFTPDPGINTLSNSSIANATYNNTVVIEANGGTVTANGNYSWQQNNGTVDVVNNSYLENQSTAYIEYGWVENSNLEIQFAALFGNSFKVAQMLVLVMVLGLLLAGVSALGGT